MSALGQKRTFALQQDMSALPPKADMCSALGDVRFTPNSGHFAVHLTTSLARVSNVWVVRHGPIESRAPLRGAATSFTRTIRSLS